MNTITDTHAYDALLAAAEPNGGGWTFPLTTGTAWIDHDNAMLLSRFCLMLDQPVTPVLTTRLFAALVDEVARLSAAIAARGRR